LVNVTDAWQVAGPPDRDDLVAWSTAELGGDELGAIPPLAGPPPDGWTELVDGRGVFVRRQAGPDGATPVWFVHGLGGSSTDWTRLSGALSRFATAYSMDLPGSGRSDPPPAGRYSPDAEAALIAQVIDQVSGGPVHLVGNSYGGVVATLLAARRPDLPRTLTLISPAVPDLRLTRDRGSDPRLGLLLLPGTARLAHRRLASIPPTARARGMGQLCFGHPELITEQDYEVAAAEHIWRAGLPWTHAATISTLRALMAGYLRRGRVSFARAAAAVTTPTLVVWGTRDRLVDVRLSRGAAAAFRQATLLVIAECGHVAQMEDPRTTARGILALWRRAAQVERPGRPVDSVTLSAGASSAGASSSDASSGGGRPEVARPGSNDDPSGRAVRVLGAPYDNLVG
jgi:pimeloyl-ACP methyl ester carboxylesterase